MLHLRKKMSLQEADDNLKKSIDLYSRDYLARETEAKTEKFSQPRWRSKYGMDTSSHKIDQRELYELRQKRWNMEDSYRYKQMKLAQAKKKLEEEETAKNREEYRKRFIELQAALESAETQADKDRLLEQYDNEIAESETANKE